MQNTHPRHASHQERVIMLAARGFRLIKLALYQNKQQLALDIADSMQCLPCREQGEDVEQLSRRLRYVAEKYDDESELHGFAESWLRWASSRRINA